MKTQYNENEIFEIIKGIYPQAVNIHKMKEGLVSQTYYFENIDTSLVFQISKDMEGYKKENYVFQTFSNKIPVKNILNIDKYQDNIYFCISEYIDAKRLHDLSENEMNNNIIYIMNILKLLQNIDIDHDKGFGYFNSKGNAPYNTWNDFIQAVFNKKNYNWNLFSKRTNEIVNNVLNEIKKYCYILDNRKSLVHGDFGSYNVLIDKKKIYLIDWGLGLYGDPLYEIANIIFWNEKCLHSLISNIMEEYIKDKISRIKIYIYLLRTGLEEIYMNKKNNVGANIEWLENRIEEIIDSNYETIRFFV